MNINIDTNKIKTIRIGDKDYPEKLLHIYAPPQVFHIAFLEI